MTVTPLPDTMRAVTFDGAGGPEVIRVVERPVPAPVAGEILLKVAAAGLNRADVQQRRGAYPVPPGASDIPGLEASGHVVARGVGVAAEDWPDGAPAMALLAAGGYAEYVAVSVEQCLPVPPSLSLVDAGGIPEVACTVVSNLALTVPVASGDVVLVHGGSGGIGTFALQFLRGRGATTIATGSTRAKLDWAAAHGADHVVDYAMEDFVERAKALTNGRGVDVVLDVVGAKYLERNVDALADGGRIVTIGLVGGTKAELNLAKLLNKRAGIIATALRSRPAAQKAQIVQTVRQEVLPALADGSIVVPVDRTFPLEDAAHAHAYFDAGVHRGKVLLLT